MMNVERCPTRQGDDLVHRYVAATLEPDAVEDFEQHLLECEACQQAVREGAAVREASRISPRTFDRQRMLFGALAAGLAAVLILFLWPSVDRLSRLARVDTVPQYERLPVRSDPDSTAALVDRAMAAYAAGAFGQAAVLLSEAASTDSSPGVSFFLGISHLRIGNYEGAAAALERASLPPGNPYSEEAHLYLAKTWIALGQVDSALAHLDLAQRGHGPIAGHAAALADSVRAVLR